MFKKCSVFSVLVVLFFAGCAFRAPGIATYGSPPDRRVIQGVHVVDVVTGEIHHDQDVWITRGRIDVIVPTGEIKPESVSQIYPARGRYIVPGLIDGHVHLQGAINPPWNLSLPSIRTNLQRLLYGGITTIIDLGTPLSKLEQASGFLRDGRYHGPDLYYSGPAITAIGGHPAPMSGFLRWPFNKVARKNLAVEVNNRAGIDAALQSIKKYNGTYAKLVVDEIPTEAPKLTPELLRYATTRAQGMRLVVAAHVGTNEDALAAIDAGVEILAHNVYRERLDEKTISRIRERGVKVIPTAGVFHRINDIFENIPVTWTTITRELSDPDVLASLYERPDVQKFTLGDGYESFLSGLEAQRETRSWNTWALREEGIPIIVGSDSPNIGWQAGAALHEEMRYLVAAGYTPTEVLRAVTAGNAEHLGFLDRGRLEPGMRADIVLLRQNPLESVAAFDHIDAVFVRGSLVARRALY